MRVRPAGRGRRAACRPRPPSAPSARGSPRPPPRARFRRISGCSAARAGRPRSFSSFSSVLASRACSAAMSITPSSGRAKVAPSTATVIAPFGTAAASVRLSMRARRWISAALRSQAAGRRRRGRAQHRQFQPHGHVHLRAGRADFLDQGDHPVHLAVGGGVDQVGAIFGQSAWTSGFVALAGGGPTTPRSRRA
jgi:hypothetical protein